MRISIDSPCYYITSVTHKRLPIFQTDRLKEITAKAFDEARTLAGLFIFAYLIMPDHYHILTDGTLAASETVRYLNGISAKRILDYLKSSSIASLEKLWVTEKYHRYKYSVWQHHPDKLIVTSDSMFLQKRNYIHQNPVKAGFVKHPDDYRFSSARTWNQKALANEPLLLDIDQIEWRH